MTLQYLISTHKLVYLLAKAHHDELRHKGAPASTLLPWARKMRDNYIAARMYESVREPRQQDRREVRDAAPSLNMRARHI